MAPVRIVDGLDWRAFAKQPKWLVGYSDVTVLHSHVHQNLGIETLHATMPINFANNTPEALESLRRALFGEPMDYEFPHHDLNRKGQAEGQLVGGNLSLLYSLAGTPSDVDTQGKILFLEDLDEYLYHIDRMMMQLQRSGKLAGLAGLIVGGMTDMKDNTIPFGKTAEQIIKEHVEPYGYPVAFGFPAGHIDDNRALVMGRKIWLKVEGPKSKVESRFQCAN
jgi:muramoyltetrapeptide carboxypeptidase